MSFTSRKGTAQHYWTDPTPDEIAGANTQAAAASNLNQKSQNKPYNAQTLYQNSQAQAPQNQPYKGSGAAPLYTPSAWYGKGLSNEGGEAAMSDPGVFADLYSMNQLGLQPGSATGQFYSNTYGLDKLGELFGGDPRNPDKFLGNMSGILDQLGKPGFQTMDPQTIVVSLLTRLAQSGKSGGQSNDPLAGLLAGQDPGTQLNTIMSFLGEALKGFMPPDMLQAYMAQLHQAAIQIQDRIFTSGAKGGGTAEFERGGGNAASALLSVIGRGGGF